MKHRQAAQVVNRRGNTPDSRNTAHTPPPRHVRIRRALNQQSAHALRKPEPGRHRQARSGDASGGLPVFRVTVTQSPAVAATPRVHLIFVSYKRQRVIGRAGNLSKIFSAKTTSGQTMSACAHAVTRKNGIRVGVGKYFRSFGLGSWRSRVPRPRRPLHPQKVKGTAHPTILGYNAHHHHQWSSRALAAAALPVRKAPRVWQVLVTDADGVRVTHGHRDHDLLLQS